MQSEFVRLHLFAAKFCVIRCRGGALLLQGPRKKVTPIKISVAPSIDSKNSTATSYKSDTPVSGGAYQDIRKVTTEWNARPKHCSPPKIRCSMHPASPSTLFSPIFSLAREKIGPPEARQKRPRRNESLQARLLILCARFFLSKPQTEFAVWVLWQICNNLSVSAAPSQHPYPFCPFGTFPPDRGNRPLRGEPRGGARTP